MNRAYLYRLSGASLGVMYVRIYRKNFFGIPKNIPKVRLFLFASQNLEICRNDKNLSRVFLYPILLYEGFTVAERSGRQCQNVAPRVDTGRCSCNVMRVADVGGVSVCGCVRLFQLCDEPVAWPD